MLFHFPRTRTRTQNIKGALRAPDKGNPALQAPLLISVRRPARENCEFGTLPLRCADALIGYVRKDLCTPAHKSDV